MLELTGDRAKCNLGELLGLERIKNEIQSDVWELYNKVRRM